MLIYHIINSTERLRTMAHGTFDICFSSGGCFHIEYNYFICLLFGSQTGNVLPLVASYGMCKQRFLPWSLKTPKIRWGGFYMSGKSKTIGDFTIPDCPVGTEKKGRISTRPRFLVLVISAMVGEHSRHLKTGSIIFTVGYSGIFGDRLAFVLAWSQSFECNPLIMIEETWDDWNTLKPGSSGI